MNISDNTYKKFIETYNVEDYQIETDTGWVDIKEVGKTIKYEKWHLQTEDGYELYCADEHILFREDFEEVYVKDLKTGDIIITDKGDSVVKSVVNTEEKVHMYDLSLDENSNSRYYTNGILSHNSMWLQNIASKLADGGKNVVYVTLEMAAHKCTKRMGAMRLRIPIDQYDELSKDSTYMKNKINNLKTVTTSSMFDDSKAGKIFTKKYPTSDCTVIDLENYIRKFEEVKKIKLDAMVIDYINLMSIEKGMGDSSMLYLKGKHLSEGLRRLADKYDVAIITATQTDKSVWGANDINLDDIPESKAIAEAADSVWGIIRNSAMKKENIYRLKILKLRDGEHHEEQVKFDFNTKYLVMENDVLAGSK